MARSSFLTFLLSASALVLPALAGTALAQQSGTAPPAQTDNATALPPVTVTATKTAQSVDAVPANVTVITNEEIEQRAPTKMEDLLGGLPGVEMVGGPRRVGQDINIRGFQGQRVVTTLDGARQNFDAGHKGRFFLDPDLLRQVDVVRGSNSALHGSGAIGGVVAMETKTASDFLNPGEMMGARAKYGYSSVARENYYSTGVFGRTADNKVDLLGNFSYRESGTLKQGGNDRELAYSAETLGNYLLKTTVQPAEFHKVTASAIAFSEAGRAPTNPDSTQNATDNPVVDRVTRMRTYAATYNYANPDTPLLNPTIKVYQNTLALEENRRFAADRSDETYLTTDGYDVYNTMRFDVGDTGHAVTFGMEYYNDRQFALRNKASRPSYPDADGTVTGHYIQDEITVFKGFTLVPTVRFDHYEGGSKVAPSITASKVSPKIGANWQALSWFDIYGSYGDAFRAPSLLELYVSGSHLGPQNLFVPNTSLQPEQARTGEVGLRFKFRDVFEEKDSLRFDVSAYQSKVKDYIETIVTITNPATFAGSTTNQNTPNVAIYGGEASARYDTKWMFSGIGASAVRGKNTDTGTHIDNIPADKITATIGGKLPEYGLRFGWKSLLVAEQNRTSGVPFVAGTAASPTTSGYHVHGLFATWLPTMPELAGFRLDAGVENLFNRTYRRHFAATNMYEEGRDYRVAVSYTKGF